MPEIKWDRWNQENAMVHVEKENRILRFFEVLAKKEPLPCNITVSADSGFRLWIKPEPGATDEDKHHLLAWLVRITGKKFVRFAREEAGTVSWWNSGDDTFDDGQGEIDIRIFFENAALGKCKFVKTIKTVEVNELVCE